MDTFLVFIFSGGAALALVGCIMACIQKDDGLMTISQVILWGSLCIMQIVITRIEILEAIGI